MAVVQRQHNKNAGVILFLYTERERELYTHIFFSEPFLYPEVLLLSSNEIIPTIITIITVTMKYGSENEKRK